MAKEAGRVISSGGLVAYPTDTVYGLGCDPFDARAVKRLILAKERLKGSLPLLTHSTEAAKMVGKFDQVSSRIARAFWPGALTLVVPSIGRFPQEVAPNRRVGLRVPNKADTLRLIRECGGRLVGTSANISGNPSCTSAEAVMSQLGDRIDLIVDGGPSTMGIESTVLEVVDGRVSVIREAAVSRERILSECSDIVFA